MATLLKQSTEIKVRVGPFVDVGDGFTPETGVALSTADEAELLKSNGAGTVDISGATWAAVTGADGWYDLTLTTSHTDTLGELVVVVQDDSVCLPVFARFQVVPANVYNSLVGGTDSLEVDAVALSGSTTAATNAEVVFDTDFATNYNTTNDKWQTEATVSGNVDLNADQSGVTIGTVNAATLADGAHGGASTVITLQTPLVVNATQVEGSDATDQINAACDAAIETYGLDHLLAASVTGTDVTDNSIIAKLASKSATADWDSFTNTTDALEALADVAAAPTAAAVADAVWDEARSGHVSAGTFGEYVNAALTTAGIAAIWSYAKASAAALATTTFGRYIYDKLGFLTTGNTVTVVEAVANSGQIIIFQGESKTVQFSVDGTTLDLTGFTPKLALTKITSNSGSASAEITGSVVNAGASDQYMTFTIPKATTAALALDTKALGQPFIANTDLAYSFTAGATDGTGGNCPTTHYGWVSVNASGITC